MARKMGRDLELQGRRRDGSQFPVDVALRSYVEGGRRYTIAAVVDLTAQGQADQIRRRFIDVLSHELRTPVTTIFGAAQVLRGRGRDLDPAIVDELVDGIIEQSDRLHRIVENLLVVARVERGVDLTGGEPVLIQRLLPRLIERAQGHWPDLRVHLHAPSDIPMVSADEASLSLLLENLISNAAKYGGAAGEVDVETRSVDGSVEVSVADRGPGVADADIPRVFELFYRAPRTEKVAPGSGIGLFVSRALAEGMGGWLRVAQRSGGGSVFTLTLPVYVAEPDEPAHSDGLVKRAGSAVRAGRE